MPDDVDGVITAYHEAAAEFVRGNPAAYKALFSQRDDVSVANPFGPVACGWTDAARVMDRASSLYKDGEIVGFKNLVKYVGGELAYIVEEERFMIRIADSEHANPVALRATSIFRREDGLWRIVHRHADPITTARPPESVVEE